MNDFLPIGLAVSGWLASTWLAYRWGLHSQALQREHQAKSAAKQRLLEFIGYIKAWRINIDRLHMVSHGYVRHPDSFTDELPEFVRRAEIVGGDLSTEKREAFKITVAKLTSSGPADFLDSGKYKSLLATIDKLVSQIEDI